MSVRFRSVCIVVGVCAVGAACGGSDTPPDQWTADDVSNLVSECEQSDWRSSGFAMSFYSVDRQFLIGDCRLYVEEWAEVLASNPGDNNADCWADLFRPSFDAESAVARSIIFSQDNMNACVTVEAGGTWRR